jgi:single-stranded-DNA-specific exonuclease
MNKYRWTQPDPVDRETALELAKDLEIPAAGARFLLVRSLGDPVEARRYLDPAASESHDPFLFEQMETAVSCVESAVRGHKKVMIHGDYDVDGISGTALLYHYLDGLVPELFRFVPDRRKDGYGVAERAVDWALENDVGLMIAVDCGTSDGELIGQLEGGGVDVIVCDHHELCAAPAWRTNSCRRSTRAACAGATIPNRSST